jgi:ubiquinol-cytochrome c reductase subunit 8
MNTPFKETVQTFPWNQRWIPAKPLTGQQWSITKTSRQANLRKSCSLYHPAPPIIHLTFSSPSKPVYCWGHKDIPRQRGIVTYMLSSNRLNPMAHTLHNAVFNTYRRSRNQVLYWGPAFVMAYLLMDWANRRSVSLVSTFARLLGLTGGDASAGTHISTRKRARRRKNVRAPDPSERSNRDSVRLTRDVVHKYCAYADLE